MDIMFQISSEHKKNVKYENGQKVSYMLILCAIYRCIESAIQWYKLYSEVLMEKVSELNPYNICMGNKLLNGKQFTLVWYVDYNKVSHMGAKVIDNLIKILKKNFGELVVSRGNKYIFWV